MYLNLDIDEKISVFLSVTFALADQARDVERLVQQVSDQARSSEDPGSLQLDSIEAKREGRRLDIFIKLSPPSLATP
jgi:hypothetical protein